MLEHAHIRPYVNVSGDMSGELQIHIWGNKVFFSIKAIMPQEAHSRRRKPRLETHLSCHMPYTAKSETMALDTGTLDRLCSRSIVMGRRFEPPHVHRRRWSLSVEESKKHLPGPIFVPSDLSR
jgi:hypothetical protein